MSGRQLRIEHVPLARRADTGGAAAGHAAWLNTGWEGFHMQPATADQLEQMLQSHEIDARVLTGVYDDSLPAGLVDPLLLGACGVGELVSAGMLKPSEHAEAASLAALLDLPGLPHAINGFQEPRPYPGRQSQDHE